MQRFLVAGLLLLCPAWAFAQSAAPDSIKTVEGTEVVISANRVPESRSNVSQTIEVIPFETIKRASIGSTAELLSQTGTITVQKSQQGGGSPVLRGFEANRVLLVIDDIRLNNLIYRGGHLQNIMTIDPDALERVEVLYGPASTVYGSDALGGVVHLRTIAPRFNQISGGAKVRYATMNGEQSIALSANIGANKWAFNSTLSYRHFGDLRQGSKRSTDYPNFGLRPFYASYVNGQDVLMTNANPNVQIGSGYEQVDALQKIRVKIGNRGYHEVNLQLSSSSNIPRYDRMTDPNGNGLRWGAWYYGPQERALASYKLELASENDIIWGFRAAYQDIQESRYQRRFGNQNLQARVEDVGVFSLRVDGRKPLGKAHQLRFGIESQFDRLTSTAQSTHLLTGVVSGLDTRYPNGVNNTRQFAGFATDTWVVSPKFTLNAGARLFDYDLKSTFADKTFFPFPFDDAKQHSMGVTGSLGAVYRVTPEWTVHTSVGTGYRAPNVDDLAKVFESATGKLIVPNSDLKPERTITADLNLRGALGEALHVEVAGYYTWLKEALVSAPFSYQGQTSVVYNGTLSAVYATQNMQEAYVTGAQGWLTWNFWPHWSLSTAAAYTYGRLVNQGIETPLDHIPPFSGKTALRFSHKLDAEVYALYNGWKRIADYRLGTEDNEAYATADGMPSWWTLNVRASYPLHPKVKLEAGVENLFDRNYRVFASGISGAGRGVTLGVRAMLD